MHVPTMKQDRAIIRLLNDFALAKETGDPAVVQIPFKGFIQLSPDEYYFQTTSIETGITLDNPTVELVDCQGVSVLDITAIVNITPIVVLGVSQITYEIAPIQQDFYGKELFLKFTSGETLWYSNGFTVTNTDLRLTTRIDYKCVGYSDNLRIDFTVAPYYNSIRIVGFFNDVEDETNVKQYIQMGGTEISSDSSITERDLYRIEYSNVWNYRRVNRILTADEIFLNGVRCTTKPFWKKEARIESSNLFVATFSAAMDNDDVYAGGSQSQIPLEVVERFPVNGGVYSITGYAEASSGGQWLIVFNKVLSQINSESNIVAELYRDGVLIYTQNAADGYIVSQNYYLIFYGYTSDYVNQPGLYTIVLTGTITSLSGNSFPGFVFGEWQFTIIGGYDHTYYDANNYI